MMNEKGYNSLFYSELFAPPPFQGGKLNYEAPKVIKLITNEELMSAQIGINTSKTTNVGNALSRPLRIGEEEGVGAHKGNVSSNFEEEWPE